MIYFHTWYESRNIFWNLSVLVRNIVMDVNNVMHCINSIDFFIDCSNYIVIFLIDMRRADVDYGEEVHRSRNLGEWSRVHTTVNISPVKNRQGWQHGNIFW